MYGWIYAAPIVLLLVTWVQVVRAAYFDETTKIAWVPLFVATLSEAYLWLSVPFHEIMGPPYSNLRYDLIYANLLTVLVVSIVVCFSKSTARWWLFAASLSLVVKWLFVRVINTPLL
jgi:hypothetical protein